MSTSGNVSNVLVYFDNSNIFISAMKHSAYLQKFLPKIQDQLIRINDTKLIELATKNRHIIEKRTYGKFPSTGLIEIKKQNGLTVFECKASKWSFKEKEADTKLTANAVEDILTYNQEHQGSNNNDDRTMILFSGDGDMLPLIQTALKHSWNVEVWAFDNSISNTILKEQKNSKAEELTSMSIHLLDNYFEQFTYYELEWHKELPSPRTLVVTVPTDLKIIQALQASIVALVSKQLKVPIVVKLQVGSNKYERCTLLYLVIAAPTCYFNIDDIVSKFPILQQRLGKFLEEKNVTYNIKQSIEIKTMPDHKNYTKQNLVEEDGIVSDTNRYQLFFDEDFEKDDNNLFPIGTNHGFKEIERKIKKQKKVKCKAGPRCHFGSNCTNSHGPEEIKLFSRYEKDRKYSGKNVKNRNLYKTRYCIWDQRCKFYKERIQCYFAHSTSEIYCLECRACVGHETKYHTNDNENIL